MEISELERRLEKIEGRFPKNGRMSTLEGHVHKPAAGGAHGQLHAMSSVLDHSGSISSGQHGTIGSGDLHTEYVALAGRPGTANNTKLSTTATGILTGSGASGETLRLVGTDHATPGLVEVQRASVTANADMLRGLIGAEANPRWAFGFDASSLVQLTFGAGGASAIDCTLRRTAARALRLISPLSTVLVTLGALTSTDTQPRWLLTTVVDGGGNRPGRFSLGQGGSVAPDAHLQRGYDPGVVRVEDKLAFKGLDTDAPTLTNDITGANFPLYLYARPPSGVAGNMSRLFASSDSGSGFQEIGPIGMLRGLLGQFNIPYGGLEVSAVGAPELAGVNAWGLLANPTIYGSTSVDAAYSPALSLTNNITSTQVNFDVTGGLPLKGDVIVIGTERIQVVQHNGVATIGQCIRGVEGTAAAAHSASDVILLAGGASQTRQSNDGKPMFEQDTGTTSGTDMGIEWSLSHCLHSAAQLIYYLDFRNLTNIRFFLGFTNQSLATMNASDNPAGEYWGIQFSTARGDTELKAVSKDGTTQDVFATGWGALVAGGAYYLRLLYDAGGDLPRVALFNSSWSQVGSSVNLTHYPSLDASQLRLVCGVRNLTAASKRMRTGMVSFTLSPSVV
jgi:hypothetical protein